MLCVTLPVTTGLEDVFSSTIFQISSIITLLLQACWVFLFSCPFFSLFSLILNGLDQDLTIHFWFQLAKLNLPAPPLLNSITLENCNVWQVSQFHEVETVSKQRRASVSEVWHKGCTEIHYSLHCLDLTRKRTCLIPFQHGYCASIGWQQRSCAPFLPLIFVVTVAYPDSSQKVWSTHLCKNCF